MAKMILRFVLVLVLVSGVGSVYASDEEMSNEEFLASFNLQSGIIDLPNGAAFLNVPESFSYIGPEDARRFLEDGWGNPNGSGSLGMLLPTDVDLFGAEGWAVVITYKEDGYVSDEDAGKIDYDDLLVTMRGSTAEANNERKELGYESIELIGWAAEPHYDADAKKMYWAKELKFGNDDAHTLNYNVRILGRRGVLVMNAVSGMTQFAKIEQDMGQVLSFAEFKEGYRYDEFDPGVDKVAAYGLAALVGGKVAAKAGLFAKLGAFLLAFKKVILIGLAAVAGILVKLFKRKKLATEPEIPEVAADDSE